MRLNLDCTRDILLFVEENTGYKKYVKFPEVSEEYELLSNKYGSDVVMYHLEQCQKSKLIETTSKDLSGNVYVKDLTPEGHSFIANIRENNVWEKTKKQAKKIGSTSLDVIIKVASSIISEAIKTTFIC